ncbi:peptidase M19 [Pelomyxa schiedti]|nr:peptidase M19 [Pelomyxa schiedti]
MATTHCERVFAVVDGHEDIGFSRVAHGRDFKMTVSQIREQESSSSVTQEEYAGECCSSLPDLKRGGVVMVFATLWASPIDVPPTVPKYNTPEEAHAQAAEQLEYYEALERSGDIEIVKSPGETGLPLPGSELDPRRRLKVVLLMEGADPIVSPSEPELDWWWSKGLRIIGTAWHRTRYSGGTGNPGPLTPLGVQLLPMMQQKGFILDISHMSEDSFWEALSVFKGPVIASHSNCRALLGGGDRHLSDDMIRALVQRDAVIGVVLYTKFICSPSDPDVIATGKPTRHCVYLRHLVKHIMHICKLAGNAMHVGIGSDIDGGFGKEDIPGELDTSADFQLIARELAQAGMCTEDIARVMGGNWINFLKKNLR